MRSKVMAGVPGLPQTLLDELSAARATTLAGKDNTARALEREFQVLSAHATSAQAHCETLLDEFLPRLKSALLEHWAAGRSPTVFSAAELEALRLEYCHDLELSVGALGGLLAESVQKTALEILDLSSVEQLSTRDRRQFGHDFSDYGRADSAPSFLARLVGSEKPPTFRARLVKQLSGARGGHTFDPSLGEPFASRASELKLSTDPESANLGVSKLLGAGLGAGLVGRVALNLAAPMVNQVVNKIANAAGNAYHAGVTAPAERERAEQFDGQKWTQWRFRELERVLAPAREAMFAPLRSALDGVMGHVNVPAWSFWPRYVVTVAGTQDVPTVIVDGRTVSLDPVHGFHPNQKLIVMLSQPDESGRRVAKVFAPDGRFVRQMEFKGGMDSATGAGDPGAAHVTRTTTGACPQCGSRSSPSDSGPTWCRVCGTQLTAFTSGGAS
jgi:hypothetical protein